MKKYTDCTREWEEKLVAMMTEEEKRWIEDFNKKHPPELDGVSFEYTQEKKDD